MNFVYLPKEAKGSLWSSKTFGKKVSYKISKLQASSTQRHKVKLHYLRSRGTVSQIFNTKNLYRSVDSLNGINKKKYVTAPEKSVQPRAQGLPIEISHPWLIQIHRTELPKCEKNKPHWGPVRRSLFKEIWLQRTVYNGVKRQCEVGWFERTK